MVYLCEGSPPSGFDTPPPEVEYWVVELEPVREFLASPEIILVDLTSLPVEVVTDMVRRLGMSGMGGGTS